MAKKVMLTDRTLKTLPPAEKGARYIVWDDLTPSFGVRVTATGAMTFVVMRRPPGGTLPVRHTIGKYPQMKLADARTAAKQILEGMLNGEYVPKAEAKRRAEAKRFDRIAESFVTEYLDKNTRDGEGARIVRRYLIPYFGKTPIDQIKRSQITAMVREIGAGNFTDVDGKTVGGPVMADRVLGRLSKLMNWYAVSDDDFVSPVIRGMRITKDKDRERSRVLSDEELQAFWLTAQRKPRYSSGPNVFGEVVIGCLLTAQRRDAVSGMRYSEISDGIWKVPPARDKGGKPRLVPLTKTMLQLIASTPRIDDCDFVFTTNGKAPFSGFSRSKRYFDKAMITLMIERATKRKDKAAIADLADIQNLMALAEGDDEPKAEAAKEELKPRWWRIHDLRRTAKTLMARAGVRPDISERALSHEIGGVEGIYDQWSYLPEIRGAFDSLEQIIHQILQADEG